MEMSRRLWYIAVIIVSFYFLVYIKFVSGTSMSSALKFIFTDSDIVRNILYQRRSKFPCDDDVSNKNIPLYKCDTVQQINSEQEYSSALKLSADKIFEADRPVSIYIGMNYFSKEIKNEKLVFAIHDGRTDSTKLWDSAKLYDLNLINGQWNEIVHKFVLPSELALSKDDEVKIYIWNIDRNSFNCVFTDVYTTNE